MGVTIETSTAWCVDQDLPLTDVSVASYAGLLGTGRYQCTPVSLTIAHVVPGHRRDSGVRVRAVGGISRWP